MTKRSLKWACATCGTVQTVTTSSAAFARASAKHRTRECHACTIEGGKGSLELAADRVCAVCETPIFGMGRGPGRVCCSYRCAGELRDREEVTS